MLSLQYNEQVVGKYSLWLWQP